MTTSIRFTTAPQDYDGFGTKTLDPKYAITHHGDPIRKVEIHNDHLVWQTMRYASGLHRASTEAELADEIRYGFAKLTTAA